MLLIFILTRIRAYLPPTPKQALQEVLAFETGYFYRQSKKDILIVFSKRKIYFGIENLLPAWILL